MIAIVKILEVAFSITQMFNTYTVEVISDFNPNLNKKSIGHPFDQFLYQIEQAMLTNLHLQKNLILYSKILLAVLHKYELS